MRTVGGSEWVQSHPGLWVAALMLSPLDAYRVTLLFVVEQAAFSGSDLSALTQWWLNNAALWLVICLGLWSAVVAVLAMAGAERRRTR